MNTNELERYVDIIKKSHPNIHLQTINMIAFQNDTLYKKYDLGN